MSFLAKRTNAPAVLAANENALRESEARFRELADNISQFAWTADAKGWIYWYNRRWHDYTGTTLEDMQGWGWQKVHHPEHVNRVVQRIKAKLRDRHAVGGHVSSPEQGWKLPMVSVACPADPQRGWRCHPLVRHQH
jgi:PAS domain S-box-containing protein